MPRDIGTLMASESESNADKGLHSVTAVDSVEIYVGNAFQSAHFFSAGFGLERLEYSGLETGARDVSAFLLGEGDLRLIVTSALCEGPVANHVQQHGDSVKDIALLVSNIELVFDRAVRNGAEPIMEPCSIQTGGRVMRKATVGTPGVIVHSLVQREPGIPPFLPNGKPLPRPVCHPAGLHSIDHVALAVGRGELENWVKYYQRAFNFEVTHQESTATELTAMRSAVVENPSRTIKIPIVEPAESKKRSQVEDFLYYHGGPGVQHLAVLCENIELSVRMLQANGIDFLTIPDSYYQMLPSRLDRMESHVIQWLKEIGVLMDRDEWGDLMQTFSKPVTGRPTLFFELVQRRGARGFGAGNIRALFEAVEREQAARAAW